MMNAMRRLQRAAIVCVLLLIMMAPAALAQEPSADRVVVGEDFVLQASSSLPANLAVIGGDADLRAGSRVNGDVALFGGDLTLGGKITGDVVVFGGNVSVLESAVVEGSLAAIGGAIDRAPGAVVRGDTFSGLEELRALDLERAEWLWPRWFGQNKDRPEDLTPLLCWPLTALGWALAVTVVSAGVMLLAPRAVTRVANAAATAPAMSFLLGLLTMTAALLAGLLLLIACCFGLVVWFVAAAALLLGWTAVGLWLGQVLARAFKLRDVSSLLATALGVFAITFLSRLPFCLGGVFGVILGSVGLGAVLLTHFGTRPYPNHLSYLDGGALPEVTNTSDV